MSTQGFVNYYAGPFPCEVLAVAIEQTPSVLRSALESCVCGDKLQSLFTGLKEDIYSLHLWTAALSSFILSELYFGTC